MRKALSPFMCIWFCLAPIAGRSQKVVLPPANLPPFQNNDTIAFLGDSITARGKWERYIIDHYRTQHPNWTLHWVNAGFPGDTASRALADRRVEHDIMPVHPTVVVVMFGMNDVSRNLYGMDSPSSEVLLQRRQRLAEFDRSMRSIVHQIQEITTVRDIILISATPYDETSVSTIPVIRGVNEGIEASAQLARVVAKDTSTPFLDLYHPMLDVLRNRQAQDASFSFNSDRIHPGPPGQLLMASLFLEAQQVASNTSIQIRDSMNNSSCTHCQIQSVTWDGDRVAFETVEAGLPTPVDHDASIAMSWTSIVSKVYREGLLRVEIPGAWDALSINLSIDGIPIGKFNGAELRSGIDLALLGVSPQMATAVAIVNRDDEQEKLIHRITEWRSLVYTGRLGDEINTTPIPLLRSTLQVWFDRQKAKSLRDDDYFYSMFKRVGPTMEDESVLRSRVRDSDPPLFPEARNKHHVYTLKVSARDNTD